MLSWTIVLTVDIFDSRIYNCTLWSVLSVTDTV